MCTFANEIKTLNLFEYEQNASKYSLFELSTPNNIAYIDVHLSHFISTPVFVALQPIKFKLVTQLHPEIKDLASLSYQGNENES